MKLCHAITHAIGNPNAHPRAGRFCVVRSVRFAPWLPVYSRAALKTAYARAEIPIRRARACKNLHAPCLSVGCADHLSSISLGHKKVQKHIATQNLFATLRAPFSEWNWEY